jgi:hypothetical protein
MKKHCRRPCASGCRGEKATFTGREYRLLFKGGRRLSAKIETALGEKFAFSNVVLKFCEILKWPTCK